MKSILIVSGILVLGILYLARILVSRTAKAPKEKPLVALVFLLTEPRRLADWQVRQAASKALGIELTVADEPRPNTIFPVAAEKVQPSLPPGAGMSFNTGERQFLINSFTRPYMEEPEKFAESIADMRLQRAVGSHRAWISADLFGRAPSGTEREEIYAILGRMLAPFVGDDCLAIYCPELERCNEVGPSVMEALNNGKPLEIFDSPTYAPIVNVSGDDPRMVAAVDEAKRRWPEFVAAFNARKSPEPRHLIKARFSDSESEEFMWLSVQQIQGDQIIGRLENSPAALKNVKEGDTVTVALNDLNDWVCEINGEGVGGFTMKVMSDVYNHTDESPAQEKNA